MANNLYHLLYHVNSFTLPSEPEVDLLADPSAMIKFMSAFETNDPTWKTAHAVNWSDSCKALDAHIRSNQDKRPTMDPTYLIPLLEAMDDCYIEELSMTFAQFGLLLEDTDYETSAMEYLHALVSKVNLLIEKGDMPDAPWVNQIPSKIVFLCRLPRANGFTTTPLLTASVLTAIGSMLEGYPRAIPEVSKIFIRAKRNASFCGNDNVPTNSRCLPLL
jgi:hypothetical protein